MTRKVLQSCTIAPDVRGRPPMWAPAEDPPKPVQRRIAHPVETFRSAGRTLMGLRGMGSMLADYGRAALKDQTAVLPYEAPKSMLNVPISGSRRVAAQSWDIKRILKVSKDRGVTLNDIVLATTAGALRRYLLANNALPDDPLIASISVSMRTGGGDAEGNAITFVLCNLATHLADPEARLEAIVSSMRATKAVMVSNVPGPRERLYWNGAELESIYPLSNPTENQALNITCLSYADHLEFGLVGCRLAVPKLQRLLDYLEDSQGELE